MPTHPILHKPSHQCKLRPLRFLQTLMINPTTEPLISTIFLVVKFPYKLRLLRPNRRSAEVPEKDTSRPLSKPCDPIFGLGCLIESVHYTWLYCTLILRCAGCLRALSCRDRASSPGLGRSVLFGAFLFRMQTEYFCCCD